MRKSAVELLAEDILEERKRTRRLLRILFIFSLFICLALVGLMAFIFGGSLLQFRALVLPLPTVRQTQTEQPKKFTMGTPRPTVTAIQRVVLVPGPAKDIDPKIERRVIAFLERNRPAETYLYAITSIDEKTDGVYLSIAGLRPDVDLSRWSMQGDAIFWDALVLYKDGTAEWYKP